MMLIWYIWKVKCIVKLYNNDSLVLKSKYFISCEIIILMNYYFLLLDNNGDIFLVCNYIIIILL